MYGNDTFFNLTVPGQIGLAVLSTILCVITIWLFLKISSRFGILVKVLIAIVLLWGFTWLSPQVYYAYYWLIFDNLPVQWVVQLPPTARDLFNLILFQGGQNLSDHSKGVMFWLLIAFAIRKMIKARYQGHE